MTPRGLFITAAHPLFALSFPLSFSLLVFLVLRDSSLRVAVQSVWAGVCVAGLSPAVYSVLDVTGSLRTALGKHPSNLIAFHLLNSLGAIWSCMRWKAGGSRDELTLPSLVAPTLAIELAIAFVLFDYWYWKDGPSELPTGLLPDSKLPNYSFRDPATDVEISLSSLAYGKGYKAALLIFIRSNADSICVDQCRSLDRVADELLHYGCNSVIVTHQTPDQCQRLAQQLNSSSIRIVRDPDLAVATKLNLRHTNGNMPLLRSQQRDSIHPSLIVVDADRTVTFAEVSHDSRVRTLPLEVLEVLRTVAKSD